MKTLALFFAAMAIPSITPAQWTQTSFPDSLWATSFAFHDSNLYAGCFGCGIFLSSDGGNTWGSLNASLPDSFVTSLLSKGSKLFAGIGRVGRPTPGVIVSTDAGDSWTTINSGLTNTCVYALATHESYICAGTYSDAFLSPNDGMNWAPAGGLCSVLCFTSFADTLFAGTNCGVYRSSDNGSSWTWCDNLSNRYVTALVLTGPNLFAGTDGTGIFLSSNNGVTWIPANTGLPSEGLYIQAMVARDTLVFAGTYAGVFVSTNSGASWNRFNQDLGGIARAFTIFDTTLFAGTDSGIWRRSLRDAATSVGNSSSSLPSIPSLAQNYPNPFNAVTTIAFTLNARAFVSLKVCDVLGKEIATLACEELSAGMHTRQWDAAPSASGLYLCRLTAGPYSQINKMILLR